jgi:DNA-directed RNA polymerase specialized sigma24 family protein
VTGPHHVVFGRDLASSLGAALDAVPARCRNLLELFIASPQLSYSEISAALGVPVGSVGPTRARCLTQLRRRLGGLA